MSLKSLLLLVERCKELAKDGLMPDFFLLHVLEVICQLGVEACEDSL